MVGIKFSDGVVPFPTGNGVWIRLLFKDDGVVQGNVLKFNGVEVFELSRQAFTTPEVIAAGDQLAGQDGTLVTYTKVEGFTFPADEVEDGKVKEDKPNNGEYRRQNRVKR